MGSRAPLQRREFLSRIGLGAAGMALSGCLSSEEERPDTRPNIVLIMADDVGIDGFGCYGSADYRTPNLDQLAQTGMRFNHCYSQPLCTPSRAKIMTGKYNFRNYTRFGALDPEETTFAHVLQDAGYRTLVAGKWQLAGRTSGTGTYPEAAGFDDYCLWQIDDRGQRYKDPLIRTKETALQTYEGRYGPDVFTEYISQFIDRPDSEPFFVYYPMCLPHAPFVPPPDSPDWDRSDYYEGRTEYFDDMVGYIDTIVGRIVSRLEETGLRENTLLLFTSDNGTHSRITSEMRDGRVIRGAKGRPTDAGTHVPLIASWPGVIPASVSDDLIDFSDFLPTLADAANAPRASDLTVDGISFLPQLSGEEGTPKEWILVDYPGREDRWPPSLFVRDQRFKLYRSGRFFDVRTDPLEEEPIETSDLSGQARAAHQKLQTAMEQIECEKTL